MSGSETMRLIRRSSCAPLDMEMRTTFDSRPSKTHSLWHRCYDGRADPADERRARQRVSAPSVLAALLAASVTAHDTYPEPDQRPEERGG
jgi:hypothetical protein